MQNKVTVSVPGKIFLLGEHAVVYGKPAILSAISQRVYVSVSPPKGNTRIESADNSFITRQLETVASHFKLLKLPPLRIIVRSRLKPGYHLGSSAAVAAATIASVVYFLKKIWNPDLFNTLAYEAEKITHGTPSGADNTAVVFGGLIWYRRELSYLKSIWQLPGTSRLLGNFFLVDTGRSHESTAELVDFVRKGYRANPRFYTDLFNINEEQVRIIAESLKSDNEKNFLLALSRGADTLVKMGVVSPTAAGFIKTVENSGGAAKILGGGGIKESVGYLLVYHKDAAQLKKLASGKNYPVEKVILAQDGIRLEEGR